VESGYFGFDGVGKLVNMVHDSYDVGRVTNGLVVDELWLNRNLPRRG